MNRNIMELVRYTYNHVPFYKFLYDKHRIDLNGDIKFESLPIIKKEDIINYPNLMISDEYNIEQLIKSHTSGTTGMQLFLYNTKEEQLKRAMLMWKERNNNCNNIIKERKAMFYDIREMENPPVQLIEGMLYLNTTYLDNDRFEQFYNAINDYQPKFIHCCPSAFYEFVRYMKRKSKRLNYTVKYIELVGEYVPSGIYTELKDFFKDTMIINYYGSFEFYSIAHSCINNNLHEVKESVYIEVVNKDEQGFGDLIVTSLINRAMPLIRYDIGDIARISKINCNCGKSGRVVELKSGRVYDYFLDGDRKITADLFRKVLTDYFKLKRDDKNFIQFSVKEIEKDVLQYNLIVTNEINVNEATEYLTKEINTYTNNEVKVIVNTDLNMLEKTGIKFRMYDLMKY